MKREKSHLVIFSEWFNTLTTHKSIGGSARGTIAAGLVAHERLKEDYNLTLDAHRAEGKSQIKERAQPVLRKS